MKRLVFIAITVLFVSQSYAQQLPLQSQYMVNKFYLNPAFAGMQEGLPIHLGVRRQWFGIKEAPVTQYVSTNTSIADGFGIGANIYNEATGPTRRTGVSLGAAYQLPLGGFGVVERRLSFGLSFMLNQHALDKTKLETYLPDDPTIQAAYSNQLLPDASFGVVYDHEEKFFGSISIVNLLQTRSDILNIPNEVRNNFVRNYYLMGGAIIPAGDDFQIRPSFLVRSIETLTTQVDVNVRAIYQDMYWFGLSYRLQDAIVAMAGVNFENFGFGYSYDYTTSLVGTFSSGSHEIRITYRMPSIIDGNKASKSLGF